MWHAMIVDGSGLGWSMFYDLFSNESGVSCRRAMNVMKKMPHSISIVKMIVVDCTLAQFEMFQAACP